MISLVAALKYLTFWGRLAPLESERVGVAAWSFVFVGLLFGCLLALVNNFLAVYVDAEILSIVLVAMLVCLSGAIHLEGTKTTFDDLTATLGFAPQQTIGVAGLLALIFVILFKVHALNILDERLFRSLLSAPVLARWTLVLFLTGYHDRCDEIARPIAAAVKLWHLAIATVLAVSLAAYLFGRIGVWISLALSLFALVLRTLLHRRHAMLTHANCGAVVEMSEALALVLLATL
jgi:adenosylcobinamide-GDP ribazoletransferase